MKISREDVRHVANLARLEIAEADLDAFAGQLGSVLEYVDLLNTVDTSQVPATSHAIELTNALRPDEVKPHLSLEQVRANAPDWTQEVVQNHEQGFFQVPRIIG